MNNVELKDWIASCVQDITFEYRGEECSIIPLSEHDMSVSFGPHRVKDYTGIDDLMNDPFWDGRSLTEIAEEIELY